MDFSQPVGENYANPKTCFFHVLFKAAGLSSARMNKKDSWLFWWTLYLNQYALIVVDIISILAYNAAAWVILGIFSVIRFVADYVLVVAVCASLSIVNIVGVTKCRKDAKKQIQGFACQAIASHFTSTIQSALSAV